VLERSRVKSLSIAALRCLVEKPTKPQQTLEFYDQCPRFQTASRSRLPVLSYNLLARQS